MALGVDASSLLALRVDASILLALRVDASVSPAGAQAPGREIVTLRGASVAGAPWSKRTEFRRDCA